MQIWGSWKRKKIDIVVGHQFHKGPTCPPNHATLHLFFLRYVCGLHVTISNFIPPFPFISLFPKTRSNTSFSSSPFIYFMDAFVLCTILVTLSISILLMLYCVCEINDFLYWVLAFLGIFITSIL